MGVDSVTTHAVVDHVHQAGLLGKGAGHAVLRLAKRDGTDIPAAASAIAADQSVLVGLFEERH
jgi:D-ornithine 4,5-aminomutase subunit alpha